MEITRDLTIPDDEPSFTASRSAGPGGQNVNKVNTRVTLRFDVDRSPSLSPTQRSRIRARLATRISKDGILRVVAQGSRSQAANRVAAVERFTRLLREALRTEKPRVPSRPSEAAERRRLEEKKRRGLVKRERRGRGGIED